MKDSEQQDEFNIKMLRNLNRIEWKWINTQNIAREMNLSLVTKEVRRWVMIAIIDTHLKSQLGCHLAQSRSLSENVRGELGQMS